MGDLEQKLESLLKEMKEIKENQKEMNEKVSKMQQIIDHIESDIYSDEGFDFEIVCPYCNSEFMTDIDENRKEIECPECIDVLIKSALTPPGISEFRILNLVKTVVLKKSLQKLLIISTLVTVRETERPEASFNSCLLIETVKDLFVL